MTKTNYEPLYSGTLGSINIKALSFHFLNVFTFILETKEQSRWIF